MPFFRVQWALKRLVSIGFYRQLKGVLAHPLVFYWAMLAKLIPGLHVHPIELRCLDASTVLVSSFMTLYAFKEIFLDGIYDVRLVHAPQSIIDIGANTGLFVLRAKRLWPHTRIVAFEPEPGNFSQLQRTIEINQLADVTAVNAAVMPNRGEVVLYRHPRNIGQHSTVHRHSGDAITVPAETLDAALKRLPGETCNLLKVDCEGAEEMIFRALTPDIARRIGAIVYEPEWRLYSVQEMNQWLVSLGFVIRSVDAVVTLARDVSDTDRGASDAARRSA